MSDVHKHKHTNVRNLYVRTFLIVVCVSAYVEFCECGVGVCVCACVCVCVCV